MKATFENNDSPYNVIIDVEWYTDVVEVRFRLSEGGRTSKLRVVQKYSNHSVIGDDLMGLAAIVADMAAKHDESTGELMDFDGTECGEYISVILGKIFH